MKPITIITDELELSCLMHENEYAYLRDNVDPERVTLIPTERVEILSAADVLRKLRDSNGEKK